MAPRPQTGVARAARESESPLRGRRHSTSEVGLYIPQGFLVTMGQRDQIVNGCHLSRSQKKARRLKYAPVENEAWYGKSTRMPWPRDWSSETSGLTLSGKHGLKMLRAAKAAQTRRDAQALQENDGDMDALVTTSGMARCMSACWETLKDEEIGAMMDAWRENRDPQREPATGNCGIFHLPDLGIAPFGIPEGAASVMARRHVGRDALGNRLHGDMLGTAGAWDAAGTAKHHGNKGHWVAPDHRMLHTKGVAAAADDDDASLIASSVSDDDAFVGFGAFEAFSAVGKKADDAPALESPEIDAPRPRRPRMRLASCNKLAAYSGPASHVFHEKEHVARNSVLRASMGIKVAKAKPPTARKLHGATKKRTTTLVGTPSKGGHQKSGSISLLAEQVDLARIKQGKKAIY